jgi:hypothetical protein
MVPALIIVGVMLSVSIIGVCVIIVARRSPRKPKPLYSKKDVKADKKRAAVQKKMDEIKEMAKPPAELPPPAPVVTENKLEQTAIPKTIQIEIGRMKDGKMAVTRKGRVTLVPRFRNNQEVFWFFIGKLGYYVDPSKIIKTEMEVGRRKKTKVVSEKLVYDVFCPEPLNQDGSITWSWEVETLLADSAMDQYITVATFESSFQLTPPLVRALIVVGFLGLLIGLSINGAVHVVPATYIHWVP